MSDYGPASYGERIADIYDEWYGDHPCDDAVDFLAAEAHGGRVLELGIGTGRLALPLAARGVEVHGIDASQAMIAKLRAKPGGDGIPVSIGDFTELAVDGRFSIIFAAFSTFLALQTQEAQLECVRRSAQRLTDEGIFVIEAFVPDVTRFDRGQRLSTTRIEDDWLILEATRHDAVSQHIVSRHIRIDEAGVKIYPVHVRYVWPSELDLMARLAGLRLRDRWGSWKREPLTAQSGRHVSVYERAR